MYKKSSPACRWMRRNKAVTPRLSTNFILDSTKRNKGYATTSSLAKLFRSRGMKGAGGVCCHVTSFKVKWRLGLKVGLGWV